MKQTKTIDHFSFYPNLWLSDPALKICSYETQGVWITMLCYMAKVEGKLFGTLSVNGKALDAIGVQRLMQIESSIFHHAWTELTDNGILKLSPTGFYYSRRLVEENKKKKMTAEEKVEHEKEITTRNAELRKEILTHLYFKLGKKLQKRSLDSIGTVRIINARIKEGYSVDDFKGIIDVKCDEWLNDSYWKKFLKCSTLFAKSHFDDYLNEYQTWADGAQSRKLVSAVLIYFKQITKKEFTPTPQNTNAILRLIGAGFTIENIQHVINVKCDEWRGTESEQYLTPYTLFNLDKFQIYLNQKRIIKKHVVVNKGKGYGDN